jgi:ribosomal protein S9
MRSDARRSFTGSCASSRFVSTGRRVDPLAAAQSQRPSQGVRARFQHTSDARIAASMRGGGAMRSQRSASTHAAARARPAAYFEMVSSAMPFVRGPINPIAAITIAIAPAMNANTPSVPKPFSTAAMTNDEKIAEKRLHEYTKPTARARIDVGKSSA